MLTSSENSNLTLAETYYSKRTVNEREVFLSQLDEQQKKIIFFNSRPSHYSIFPTWLHFEIEKINLLRDDKLFISTLDQIKKLKPFDMLDKTNEISPTLNQNWGDFLIYVMKSDFIDINNVFIKLLSNLSNKACEDFINAKNNKVTGFQLACERLNDFSLHLLLSRLNSNALSQALAVKGKTISGLQTLLATRNLQTILSIFNSVCPFGLVLANDKNKTILEWLNINIHLTVEQKIIVREKYNHIFKCTTKPSHEIIKRSIHFINFASLHLKKSKPSEILRLESWIALLRVAIIACKAKDRDIKNSLCALLSRAYLHLYHNNNKANIKELVYAVISANQITTTLVDVDDNLFIGSLLVKVPSTITGIKNLTNTNDYHFALSFVNNIAQAYSQGLRHLYAATQKVDDPHNITSDLEQRFSRLSNSELIEIYKMPDTHAGFCDRKLEKTSENILQVPSEKHAQGILDTHLFTDIQDLMRDKNDKRRNEMLKTKLSLLDSRNQSPDSKIILKCMLNLLTDLPQGRSQELSLLEKLSTVRYKIENGDINEEYAALTQIKATVKFELSKLKPTRFFETATSFQLWLRTTDALLSKCGVEKLYIGRSVNDAKQTCSQQSTAIVKDPLKISLISKTVDSSQITPVVDTHKPVTVAFSQASLLPTNLSWASSLVRAGESSGQDVKDGDCERSIGPTKLNL